MDKQTTFAFIIIGLILVVWLYFSSPAPQPQSKKKGEPTVVDKKDTAAVKPPVQQKQTAKAVLIPLVSDSL